MGRRPPAALALALLLLALAGSGCRSTAALGTGSGSKPARGNLPDSPRAAATSENPGDPQGQDADAAASPGQGADAAAPLRLAVRPGHEAWARRLAAEWQALWPDLQVRVATVAHPRESLGSGDADLALVTLAPEEAPPPGAALVAWEYELRTVDFLSPAALTTGGMAPAPAAGEEGAVAAGAGPAAGAEDKGTAAADPAAGGEAGEGPAFGTADGFSHLSWGQVPLPVAGVAATPETIATGAYPLARPLWLLAAPDAPGDQRMGAVPLNSLLARTGTPERVQDRSGLTAPTGRPTRPVTLAAVGDVVLARGVGRLIREQGPDYPVAQVRDLLSRADLTLGNLESPIGVQGHPIPGKGIWFRADPEALETLTLAGFDLVTVANNHIMDYGLENFAETLSLLEEAGIAAVGGGPDLAAARRPVVREVAGLRLAFLGYSQFAHLFWSWEEPLQFAAEPDRAGVAPLDEAILAADIRRARAQADVVVVTVHWGEEYQNIPTPTQVRLARKMVDLGADLVLGHHPHAVQGFEVYNGGFIAYSMGNFIMDQERLGPTVQESMVLEFTWYPGGGRTARVRPAWISGYRPALLGGAEGAALLAKLRQISAAIP